MGQSMSDHCEGASSEVVLWRFTCCLLGVSYPEPYVDLVLLAPDQLQVLRHQSEPIRHLVDREERRPQGSPCSEGYRRRARVRRCSWSQERRQQVTSCVGVSVRRAMQPGTTINMLARRVHVLMLWRVNSLVEMPPAAAHALFLASY